MASVWIPSPMQNYTQGESIVEVCGKNIRELVDNLEQDYSGIKHALVQDGMLRPGVSVAVDGKIVYKGLLQQVSEDSEAHLTIVFLFIVKLGKKYHEKN